MGISRRSVLKGGVASVAGAALAGPFAGLLANPALALSPSGGYGPLSPATDVTTGAKLISLPKGFTYRTFGAAGSVMTDGHITPPSHDGMDCFAARGTKIRLVRNHETGPQLGTGGSAAPDGSNPYDPACNGGTTTLEVDLSQTPAQWGDVPSWSSMTGTYFNCSGGPSAYGTWFSCEELPGGPDLGGDFFGNGEDNLTKKHGYIYEVDPAWGPGENPEPTPITQAGRLTHEGAVMDPSNGYLYMTQDDFFGGSGFYRYIPPNNAIADRKVEDGGKLQMLKVFAIDNAKLELHQKPGTKYKVSWVDIADPDPTHAQGTPWLETLGAVSSQGFAQGAASFSRLEGIRLRGGKVYFNSTQGGQGREGASSTFGPGFGQVWCLDLMGMVLRLVFEAPPRPDPTKPVGPGNLPALSLPDNLAISPKGALVLCEDGTVDRPDRGFVVPHNFIRGLSLRGELFDFCENLHGDAEFTGACFSADGKSMFFNIQTPGRTYEVRGPWAQGPW